MTGLLIRKGKTYIFREDDFSLGGFVAWDIYDLKHRYGRERWNKLPAGDVILFDIDNPPATVSYFPALGVYA
jgi:hypothetical protein